MADDFQQQLMAQQSLLAASQGAGGKGSPLLHLMGFGTGRDLDVFAGLSIKGKGLNADKTAPTVAFGKQNGPLAALFKELKGEGILPGLQKVAQAGAPKQINSITEITGSGMSGGVAANIAGPSMDDGVRSA